MTCRQLLLRLQIGESHEFESLDAAKSAASNASHIYGRRYTRAGLTITRIA